MTLRKPMPNSAEIKKLVATIGRKRLSSLLQLGSSAISNAVSRGYFAADCYLTVKSECQKHGIACSDDLFGFKQPDRHPAQSGKTPNSAATIHVNNSS